MARRLLWNIYPWQLLITVASIGIITYYSTFQLREFYLTKTEHDLKVRAVMSLRHIFSTNILTDSKAVDQLCKSLGKEIDTRITVINLDGVVLGDSKADPSTMDNHGNRPEILESLAQGQGSRTRYSKTLKKNLMYVAVPLKDGDTPLAVIRTSIPVSAIDQRLHDIYFKIGGMVLLVFLACAVVSLAISKRIVRPLFQLKEAARKFASGNFVCYLPPSNTIEIETLADNMREMARQLDERIRNVVEERMKSEVLLTSLAESVIAVDPEMKIMHINPAAERMLGASSKEIAGKHVSELLDNKDILDFLSAAMTKSRITSANIPFMRKGRELVLEANFSPIESFQKETIGSLMVLQDITERKRLMNELQVMATTDHLTKATNRRQFMAMAEREMNRKIRYGHTFCIAMLDADHFKRINDTWGHHIGDEVLKSLTSTVQDELRNTDILGRLGGEEFAILLPNIDFDSSLQLCERLRTKINSIRIKSDDGQDVSFTLSMGLAESTPEMKNDTLEEMLKRADNALYEAKNSGRDCIRPLSDNMT